jgi:hypothetical protein
MQVTVTDSPTLVVMRFTGNCNPVVLCVDVSPCPFPTRALIADWGVSRVLPPLLHGTCSVASLLLCAPPVHSLLHTVTGPTL